MSETLKTTLVEEIGGHCKSVDRATWMKKEEKAWQFPLTSQMVIWNTAHLLNLFLIVY